MAEPVLEVRHLSKSFGANVVLRDIDFTTVFILTQLIYKVFKHTFYALTFHN